MVLINDTRPWAFDLILDGFMHGLCENVSDGERYVVIVLFRPQCNFMASIIKRPPSARIIFRGAYIRNYTVSCGPVMHAFDWFYSTILNGPSA